MYVSARARLIRGRPRCEYAAQLSRPYVNRSGPSARGPSLLRREAECESEKEGMRERESEEGGPGGEKEQHDELPASKAVPPPPPPR